MALFEQQGAPPPSLTFRAPHIADGNGTTLSAVPSYTDLPGTNSGLNGIANGGPALGGAGVGALSMGSGHDRPYRFSFYSNALSATIHAKSLSELPAEGQSFEDLFLGTHSSHHHDPNSHVHPHGLNFNSNNLHNLSSRPSLNPRPSANGIKPGTGTPPIPSGISKMSAGNGGMGGLGAGRGGNAGNGRSAIGGMGMGAGMGGGEADSNTWWLDIQSPTEEEMKLLGKVLYSFPSCFPPFYSTNLIY